MNTSIDNPFSQEEIQEHVSSVKYWRHSIDFGQGVISPGTLSHESMEKRLNYIKIPENLSGKSVIDVGAWDGFFSFECERRGAARVVAADHHVWHKSGMAGFQCAQKVLGSKVEAIDITVEDLSPNMVGEFDICLFLDVLYHLKKPMFCLERIAEITKEMLILETLVYRGDPKIPSMRFFNRVCRGCHQLVRSQPVVSRTDRTRIWLSARRNHRPARMEKLTRQDIC